MTIAYNRADGEPFQGLALPERLSGQQLCLHPLNEADFRMPTDVAKEPIKQNLD
jgi:hypothetical protein